MLAIDTAFITANLALENGDRKVYRTLDSNAKHSENVLKNIEQMCQELGVDVLDVQTVAVVTGPGSFTGLRIGTAIAKALYCANKSLKLVSLSSLELLAYIVCKLNLAQGEFVCAINALSDLFFVANFSKDGKMLQPERMIPKAEFDALNLPVFGLKGDMPENMARGVELTSAQLLEFANQKASLGEFVSEEELLPKYLRLSQAEADLQKKKKI